MNKTDQIKQALEQQDAALSMWKKLLNDRAFQSVNSFVQNERNLATVKGCPAFIIDLTSDEVRKYIYSIGLGYNSFDF